MKLVLQRSGPATVTIDSAVVGRIEHGLVILVGIAEGDREQTVATMAAKTLGLRIFEDDAGKMNRNVGEVGGGILAISQFTLLADVRKGRRPSFTGAARPQIAQSLYDLYCQHLSQSGVSVAKGIFGADMQVQLINRGPVTLVIDSSELAGH